MLYSVSVGALSAVLFGNLKTVLRATKLIKRLVNETRVEKKKPQEELNYLVEREESQMDI